MGGIMYKPLCINKWLEGGGGGYLVFQENGGVAIKFE
jgi:hypothetical protein